MINILTGTPFASVPRLHHREDELSLEGDSSAPFGRRNLVGMMGVMMASGKSSPIPSEYQQIKSIYGSGAGQMISTGVQVSNRFGFEATFNLTRFRAEQTSGRYFNVWRTDGAVGFVHRNTQYSYVWGTTTQLYKTYHTTSTDECVFGFNYMMSNKLTMTDVADTELPARDAFSASDDYPFELFGNVDGNNINRYQYKMELFGFKVSVGTEIVRDFVPVKRKSDGEVGLWDLVTKQFFGNIGSGSFTGTELT